VTDWLGTFLTSSPTPDLLRLLAVPVFGWAAYRDIRTRRVPNLTWLPLALLGVGLLAWDVARVSAGELPGGMAARERFYLRVALSLGMVGSIGYLFYWLGGFGGADAKALIVLAVLFPTFPTYILPNTALPLTRTTVGVFSLTILSNTVLAGVAYPLAIALRNLLRGRVSLAMFIGRPVPVGAVVEEYGRLLETPEGFTRSGLDIDALRMYLQWRGGTLDELRAAPDRYRNPESLPDEPNPPGDGALATDGGEMAEQFGTAGRADPWGAEAFLEDIDHSAYGTSADQLRDGLEVLARSQTVWISPGIPFLVPMFAGLVVSLTYGDVLFSALRALGLA
jgi:preflagellin peptidase FlaK